MSNDKIWLTSPHMGGDEMEYIEKAFNTNWIAPLGPNVNKFEKVDLEDLKALHPTVKIVHLLVDTSSNLTEEWFVIDKTTK